MSERMSGYAGPSLRRQAREGAQFVNDTNVLLLRRWACELAGQTAQHHPQWEAQHVVWLAQAILELVQYGIPTETIASHFGRADDIGGSGAEARESRPVRASRGRQSTSDQQGD